MKTATATKSKWKAWHVILLVIIIGFVFVIKRLTGNADAAAEAQRLAYPALVRQDKIKALTSQWDGSSIALVENVKANMHDAKSFELVDNKIYDTGSDTLHIIMQYRGKNAFGATVIEQVKAEQTLNGNIIKLSKD